MATKDDEKAFLEKVREFGLFGFMFAIIFILVGIALYFMLGWKEDNRLKKLEIKDIVLEARNEGCYVGYNLNVTDNITDDLKNITINTINSAINNDGSIEFGFEQQSFEVTDTLSKETKDFWKETNKKSEATVLEMDSDLYLFCLNGENKVETMEEVIRDGQD